MQHPPGSIAVHKRRPSLKVTAAAVAAVLLAAVLMSMAVIGGSGHVPALSGLCGSCHEMEPKTASWRASSHSKVGCYACHDPAYAWYDLPRNVFGSSSMLMRKLTDNRARGIVRLSTEETSTHFGAVEYSDDACLKCHSLKRAPSNRSRVIIDHPTHAERNGSCLSCHHVTTHPEPGGDLALLMMEQCYRCHNTPEQPAATGACEACHPSDFDLLPASHEPKEWQSVHGENALRGSKQCLMCHTSEVCTTCHEVEMPHPEDWTGKGAESVHAQYSPMEQGLCVKCHEATPSSCSTCHHGDHNPVRGLWEKEHRWVVRQNGTASCMQCHDPVVCKDCHG